MTNITTTDNTATSSISHNGTHCVTPVLESAGTEICPKKEGMDKDGSHHWSIGFCECSWRPWWYWHGHPYLWIRIIIYKFV